MDGLTSELKTIVMTKEPKNVEELRHCATLAEKAISSNTVNIISQTVLEEIQILKDQLKSVNKGNNKITELRTILQRESQNS